VGAASVPVSRKRMLLTCTPPVPDGVGGIILSDLCALLPIGSLCISVLTSKTDRSGDSRGISDVPVHWVHVPYAAGLGRQLDPFRKFLKWVSLTVSNGRALIHARRSCVNWGRAQGVQELWAVLDAPASIKLAECVARDLQVPLRLVVWDDIDHNTRHFNVDRLTSLVLKTDFSRALHASTSCAVIGEEMQASYEAVFGVRAVILRHGIAPAQKPLAQGLRQLNSCLIIGFAGSVSARSAFDALLAALDQAGWELRGRPVILRLFGQRFTLEATTSRRIDYRGWLPSTEATVAALAECDVGYLPQPFEPDWAPFSRLSFPTKLSTYLAADLPVLIHAPEWASLPRFLARYPIGTCCSSLDQGSITNALLRLMDADILASCADARIQAIRQEFSPEVFRSRFAAFLDVDEAALNA